MLEWFQSRAEDAVVIETWRPHYDAVRLHRNLDYLTVMEFKQQHRPSPPTYPSSRNDGLERGRGRSVADLGKGECTGHRSSGA